MDSNLLAPNSDSDSLLGYVNKNDSDSDSSSFLDNDDESFTNTNDNLEGKNCEISLEMYSNAYFGYLGKSCFDHFRCLNVLINFLKKI